MGCPTAATWNAPTPGRRGLSSASRELPVHLVATPGERRCLRCPRGAPVSVSWVLATWSVEAPLPGARSGRAQGPPLLRQARGWRMGT